MNTLRRSGHRRLQPIVLIGLMALLLSLLVPPQAALAHALDVYLQATYITVAPTQIMVELDLTPGVLVAPQVLSHLDPNNDQQITDSEGRAYAEAMLRNVVLQVDGQPQALTITKLDVPAYLNVQSGYGTIRIFTAAALAAGSAGTHQIVYKNNFAPTNSAYQVNAFVDKGVAITLGKQNRDSLQHGLTMDFVIGSPAPAASVDTPTGNAVSASEPMRQLVAYLQQPTLTPWVVLLALALAVVLGGLHALTPGHGKTLVAAYLVGSRGTPQHAIWLGSITTITHTASVLIVGVLALTAQQFIKLDVLVPLLEVGSGVLVVLMGLRLVLARWRAMKSEAEDAPHDHGFGAHTHALNTDDHTHTSVSRGGILAMGVSGGLIPCPEALGLMLIAIGLNRAALGLGLVVAFSLGLAVVLIVLGMLLVRSKSLIERAGKFDGRWQRRLQRWLALGSACVVTLLGVGLMLKGLKVF